MSNRDRSFSLSNWTTSNPNTLLAVSLCFIAACSDSAVVDDNRYQYTNDLGEEIYGPDYRPRSPTIESIPLLVGRPNAGYQVSQRFKDRSHDDLLAPAGISESSTSAEATTWPLLKKYSDRIVNDPVSSEVSGEAVDGNEAGDSGDASITLPIDLLDTDEPAVMTVHYVFVGQGDATIIEFPCGVAVIDSGGEFGGGNNVDGGEMFIDYLTEFFEDRPQFDDTIDVLFTTHPHADHLNGLPLLTNDNGELLFSVNNVVDNGQTPEDTVTRGSLFKQKQFRHVVRDNGGDYSAVELSRQVSATGATNAVIDPFDCDDVDPVITVFWGGLNDELPADELLSTSEYRTPNNHSVVIRVDFGDASFLFTGDLEDKGETDMRAQYKDNLDVFDVDVYQVSHHGADNDTSEELLEIMTPDIAVISMGSPLHSGRFNAASHGHPRSGLIAELQDDPGIVFDLRDPAEEFLTTPGHNQPFADTLIERAIFGTAWEGTVLIEANSRGEYEIFTD